MGTGSQSTTHDCTGSTNSLAGTFVAITTILIITIVALVVLLIFKHNKTKEAPKEMYVPLKMMELLILQYNYTPHRLSTGGSIKASNNEAYGVIVGGQYDLVPIGSPNASELYDTPSAACRQPLPAPPLPGNEDTTTVYEALPGEG